MTADTNVYGLKGLSIAVLHSSVRGIYKRGNTMGRRLSSRHFVGQNYILSDKIQF